MDLGTLDLRDLFPSDEPVRDDSGALAAVAGWFPPPGPRLLVLASPDGELAGVDDFGAGGDLSVARRLAGDLARRLADQPACAWDEVAAAGPQCAFGFRVPAREGWIVLGGLLAPGTGAEALSEIPQPTMTLAAAMAWDNLQLHQARRRLETQVRHLRAEHETLRSFHSEMLVEAVEERERRLRVEAAHAAHVQAIMDTAPDGLVVIDEGDRVVSFNRAAERLFGIRPEEAQGADACELIAPPQYRMRYRRLLRRLRRRKDQSALGGMIRVTGFRRNGDEFPAELSLSTLVLDDRWHAILAIRDVTERDRIERELAGYRQRLERLVARRTIELTKANNALHHEVTERRHAYELLRLQRDLASALSATSNVGEALGVSLDSALKVSGMKCGAIHVVEEGGAWVLAAARNLSSGCQAALARLEADSPEAHLIRSSVPQYTTAPEYRVPVGEAYVREGLRAVAVVPIHHEGRALACVTVGSHTLERVPEQARTSLEAVAAQVGSVIARITAQEAQKRNELKYRLLAENLKDVVFSMDLEGRVTYCSPAVREFGGYDPAAAIGRNVHEFIPFEDDWRRAWAIVAQMVRDQAPASTEIPYRRRDGSVIPVEITGKPLIEDGRVVSIQCVMRDISERRRNEEELRQAKLAAEAANRAKSEFLTNISHEIRTPMTAILGFAEILMGTLPEGECLHAARTIRRNGEYLMEIINDILDLSKIEAGRFEIHRDRCSPHQILDDVVSLMRVRAGAKGLPLTLEFEGPLPATIATDPVRLRQILINLLGNAIKFTEAGEVRLRARLINHAGEPKLECEVIDTGIGMSEAQVKRLFRPFTQGDATTSRRFGGTGLGLTISKRLAAMLDGDIAVQSVPGKGSTFRLTVATGSLDGVPIVEAGEAIRDSSEGAAPMPSFERLAGCRILLAEDGPDNQRLIAYLLRKAGAEVVVVANGQEAVERALAKAPCDEGQPSDVRSFDLILMDLQMPVMAGYEATRVLRHQGVDIPIVALSAHAMVEMAQQCLAMGFDDYASKPIDRGQLLTLAAEHVARYRRVRALGEAAPEASQTD